MTIIENVKSIMVGNRDLGNYATTVQERRKSLD